MSRMSCGKSPTRHSSVVSRVRYCWHCHKSADRDDSASCGRCPRTYHKKCLSTEFESRCPECVDIGKDMTSDRKKLNHVLEKVVAELISKNDCFRLLSIDEDNPKRGSNVVNPMDLTRIKGKTEKRAYSSANGFLSDIKWINHNSIVYQLPGLKTKAKSLLSTAEKMCQTIGICLDCSHNFYLMDNHYEAVCKRPHNVVWAKVGPHPYWPAKSYQYDSVRKKVLVGFFGTHDLRWVAANKTFMISEGYPFQTSDPILAKPISEMKAYITQLKNYFGVTHFKYRKGSVFAEDRLYVSVDQPIEASEDLIDSIFDDSSKIDISSDEGSASEVAVDSNESPIKRRKPNEKVEQTHKGSEDPTDDNSPVGPTNEDSAEVDLPVEEVGKTSADTQQNAEPQVISIGSEDNGPEVITLSDNESERQYVEYYTRAQKIGNNYIFVCNYIRDCGLSFKRRSEAIKHIYTHLK